jgi:hypothetical protein
MGYEKYKEECKDKWLSENSHKSQLMGNNILPMRPDFGFFITVEKLEISEDIFKEEYDAISKAYFSIMKKLDEHYKKSNSNLIKYNGCK